MRSFGLAIALACAGCSALFGLDNPARMADASAEGDDAPGEDAGPDDAPADVGIDGPPTTPQTRAISVAGGKVTNGPHADFPLLFSTTQTWLRTSANGGDVASGNDIYFSSDQAGTNRLAHEVESYSPSSGAIVAWVKIPSLTGSTTLYIHYGDTSITTSQQNRTAVWTGYAFVAHTANGALTDVTSNSAAVTATGLANTAGQIESAVAFDGAASTADVSSPSHLDGVFTDGGTAQAWIRPSTFGENGRGRIFDKDANGGWLLYVDAFNAPNTLAFSFQTSGNDGQWYSGTNAISANTWQHVVVRFDTNSTANDPEFFVNGASIQVFQSVAISGNFDSDDASPLLIGNNMAGDRTFDGSLDELRISTTGRSPGWISTEYQNQSAPGAFYTIGAPL